MTETTSTSNQAGMDQVQAAQWFNEQFNKATKHLADQGVLIESVFNDESTYVAPMFAIFKIRSKDRKKYWVIAGDLPTDYTPDSAAKDFKAAMRHFSLHWQMKAENMIAAGIRDTVQRDFAQLLVTKAEALYAFIDNKIMWDKANKIN